MKKICLVICLLLFCGALSAEYYCGNNDTEGAIKRLGYSTDSATFRKEMTLLSRNPSKAVSCLIEELQIVQETKVLPKDADKHKSTLHIIWCIRALRYLTGIDFTGKTTYEFKKAEEDRTYFLKKDRNSELPFFAVWMSHDVIYIAPEDAQKEIIEKWGKWYSINGESFKYEPVDDINKWYF